MRLTRAAKERISAGIGALLFLAAFVGLGSVGLWGVGKAIYDGWRARAWVPVQAQIAHVDTGSATFTYEWQGRRHIGERVGTFVLGGSTDLDDWEDRMDEMLSAAVEGRKPATAYVNPADPSEAMLDRQIRWKLMGFLLLFALVFTLAGLVAAVALGRRAIGGKGHGGGVPLLKPKAREALTQWAVALVWNLVAIPIALIAIPEFLDSREWFPVVLLAVFGIFGLLILWGAFNNTVAVLRDGSPFNARTAS